MRERTQEASLPTPSLPEWEETAQSEEREGDEFSQSIQRALDVLAETQAEDGSWRGDYGGPLFLLPMYVATHWLTGEPLPESTRQGMLQYIQSVQNEDGGWGLDEVSSSLVFTTSINYVALRFLGASADEDAAVRARAWLHQHGGPVGSASWGKLLLAVLNLYDYEGVDPVQPELWLLPKFLPFHPTRLWCHARMVYLPMSYLYGMRATQPLSPLVEELRAELYPQPYDTIQWSSCRGKVASTDATYPRSGLIRMAHKVMSGYEAIRRKSWRERSLALTLEHIRYEDEQTHYICIGPVNKVLNTWVWHFANPEGPELQAHLKALPLYQWETPNGIKMQGYNSSQLWDTTFAVQAMLTAQGHQSHPNTYKQAMDFIDNNQVLEDPPEAETYARHEANGGWPFSTLDHGWPISDCTAEGAKTVMTAEDHTGEALEPARLRASIKWILGMQNKDGGWATYEPTRGPNWLELLNPSDVFGNIMIDYSHVECSSACIQALVQYKDRAPESLQKPIERAIQRGVHFLSQVQRNDGAWLGGWGVCFTYGTWFGVWGLLAAGVPATDKRIQQACEFLVSHQRKDGGWSESTESCHTGHYTETDESQPIRTAWALMALIAAGWKEDNAIQQGLHYLRHTQQEDGTWPEEHIAGIFNQTCAIHYDNYGKIFPLWALALAQQKTQTQGFH
ncbi:MAG: squalene--hopene cyclase [Deltaproteobacteria bacterium]|nr:MAG: squalene--hopene cyclase [Deltaproteobacteria bacterium]